MLGAVLAHGHPQIVMWYSYFDLLNSHNYTKHWTDLTKVVGGVPAPSTSNMPTLAHCSLEFYAVRWLAGQAALRCV